MNTSSHKIGARFVGFTSMLLALFLVWAEPALFEFAKVRVFDQYQRLSPRESKISPVVIVEIDDASLTAIGQWPWPRHKMAKIIDKLSSAGAASIALDIIYSEPDRTSPMLVSDNWVPTPSLINIISSLNELKSGTVDHDRIFASSLRNSPSILSLSYQKSNGSSKCVEPLERSRVRGITPAELSLFSTSYANVKTALPILRDNAAGEGFAGAHFSQDAIVRTVPLITLSCRGSEIFPSLVLEALRVGMPNLTPESIAIPFSRLPRDCRTHVLGTGGSAISEISLCGLKIPTTPEGEFWVHYSKSSNVRDRTISVSDVLDSEETNLSDLVNGKIVLIGTTAAGLKDTVVIPTGSTRAGVQVHAEIIDQILNDQMLFRAWDVMRPIEIGIAILVSIILLIYLPQLSATNGFFVWILSVIGLVMVSYGFFVFGKIIVDPVTPSLVLSPVFLSSFVILFEQEQKARAFVQSAFGKFLSPQLLDRLEHDPTLLKLEGEEKEITAFFSDIRNFTSISEHLTPQQVTLLLNIYFTPMARIVFNNDGMIDKYMGDGLVVMWNAPIDVENHSLKACRAALQMVSEIDSININISQQLGFKVPELKIGIGIHAGLANVGNFGSNEHLQYSMIGDMVNLTSRLEQATKDFDVPIIVSGDIVEKHPELNTQFLGNVIVKGREQSVSVFSLISLS